MLEKILTAVNILLMFILGVAISVVVVLLIRELLPIFL